MFAPVPRNRVHRPAPGVAPGPRHAPSAASRQDLVRHLHQTYGNLAAQRFLSSASTAPRTSPPGLVRIQRYGSIRFANLATTKPAYVEKANDIVTGLQGTPRITNFLLNKNVLITLEWEPMLASVRINADQVQIKLSPWFFEQESRGRILGMLAHEFGVHPLAREAMTATERTQEDTDFNANTAFPTGIHGHSVTPQAAGQRDHIFAAVQGQPRYEIYRQTVHQMTTAMLHQTRQVNATMREAHVTDAIMTYLSDVAMILATNDQRNEIVTNPGRTADCFNLERTAWLAYVGGLGGADNVDLIRLTPPTKSGGDVLREAGGLMRSFFVSVFTNSTSTDKTVQANGAQTTTIQNEVLVDYGLTLQPSLGGNPTPSLFEALNGLGVAPNTRTKALNNLTIACNKNPRVDAEYNLLNPVRQRLTTGTINEALDDDTLNAIAFVLTARIRVIQPNGKIMLREYGAGPVFTVLQVDKPAPHYRFAT